MPPPPTAAHRAFTLLCSKIHPQLPISSRESQQLLNLLVTSFRKELDKQHPPAIPQQARPNQPHHSKRTTSSVTPQPLPLSSHTVASKHVDSILNNPLFSVTPRRRGSDAFKVAEAGQILSDPLAWFLEEVAQGTADVRKAVACLDILKSRTGNQDPKSNRQPGSVIAEWLWSSGQQLSTDVIRSNALLDGLVSLLMKEGKLKLLWQWFSESIKLRNEKSGLEATQLQQFSRRLAWRMMDELSLDRAVSVFLRMQQLLRETKVRPVPADLGVPGKHIFDRIISNSMDGASVPLDTELYDAFIQSMSDWTRGWRRLLPSMLWVYHPSQPNPGPGLKYLRDMDPSVLPASARPLLSQLTLGVAHRLVTEGKFADAEWVVDFFTTHFPEIVAPQTQDRKVEDTTESLQSQQHIFDMLDRLAPA